ncbi:hypothetical protein QZH41_000817 [Actinostola sp. cb2023]|nr:hypothetical protein QZH41_000817 [Actinostola sp. cb2023]
MAVDDRPVMTSYFATKVVNESESVYVQCISDANPGSTYYWTHNGKAIAGGRNGIIFLSHVTRNDSGTLICNASNILGSTSKTIYLFVHSSKQDERSDRIGMSEMSRTLPPIPNSNSEEHAVTPDDLPGRDDDQIYEQVDKEDSTKSKHENQPQERRPSSSDRLHRGQDHTNQTTHNAREDNITENLVYESFDTKEGQSRSERTSVSQDRRAIAENQKTVNQDKIQDDSQTTAQAVDILPGNLGRDNLGSVIHYEFTPFDESTIEPHVYEPVVVRSTRQNGDQRPVESVYKSPNNSVYKTPAKTASSARYKYSDA